MFRGREEFGDEQHDRQAGRTSRKLGRRREDGGRRGQCDCLRRVGQIVWLMTQSPAHKNFFISDLEWMVMPPMLLRQFRIFPGKSQPMGVALWASLSPEVEKRLEAGGTRLAPNEWKSGDSVWLVDLIAPFGHQETMLEDIKKKTIFAGKSFKMHLNSPEGRKVVTIEPEASATPTAPGSPAVN